MKCEWIILISKLVKKIMGDEEAFKYAGRLGLGMGMRAGTFQLTSIQALVRREDSWSPQGRPWDCLWRTKSHLSSCRLPRHPPGVPLVSGRGGQLGSELSANTARWLKSSETDS